MTEPLSTNDPAARANTFPWPPVLLIATGIAAWTLGRFVPVPWPGIEDMPAHIFGIGFGVIGLGLAAWSIQTLSRAGTTVMPHGTSTALVTRGPYARFRNPIYLADAMLLLCVAELSHNIWFVAAAALFAVLTTTMQILPEERHLSARFGTAYDAYKSRTRRWI